MPQTKINLCQADYEGSTSGFVSDEELQAASGFLQAQIAPSGLFVKRDGTTPLTADWDVGGFEVQDAGVVAVQPTAPPSPPVGRLWLDSSACASGVPQALPIRHVTADYSPSFLDTVLLVNATASGLTISLPTASGVNLGKVYHVKKIDSTGNTVTVQPMGSSTIDDDSNQIIASQYNSMMIVSDGDDWWVV